MQFTLGNMQTPDRITIDFKTREEAVYDALRTAIIQGRWGPEEGLVVSRIAIDLGVSRITVANALKRLAGEGFVYLTPHKEAVVARLDPAEIREIYLMRAELGALSLREVAPRLTDNDLAEIFGLNEELRTRAEPAERDLTAIRAADRTFHRRIYLVAGMPRLAKQLDNLADQAEYYRARLLDLAARVVPTAEGHLPLLSALVARDAGLASELMREHVLIGMRAILAMLDGGQGKNDLETPV